MILKWLEPRNKLENIRERRDYFLRILTFMCIHGLDIHYLCTDITMCGYYRRRAQNMELYMARCESNFIYIFSTKACSFHWNQLPPCLKESISLNDFSHSHRLVYGWRLSEFMIRLCVPLYFTWSLIISTIVMVVFNWSTLSGIRLYLILICLFNSLRPNDAYMRQ